MRSFNRFVEIRFYLSLSVECVSVLLFPSARMRVLGLFVVCCADLLKLVIISVSLHFRQSRRLLLHFLSQCVRVHRVQVIERKLGLAGFLLASAFALLLATVGFLRHRERKKGEGERRERWRSEESRKRLGV